MPDQSVQAFANIRAQRIAAAFGQQFGAPTNSCTTPGPV
jgi:hypothetical protein